MASQAISYRRSSGERRQQLKWLMTGSAAAPAGIGISFLLPGGAGGVFALAGFAALPRASVWPC